MIRLLWRMLFTHVFWRMRLGGLGYRTTLFKPLLVTGAKNIFIGARSQIRDFARLEVIRRPQLGWDATLRIGDRVNIEQGVHIVCQCEVTIDDDVSITPYCVVVDTDHPFDPPDVGPKIGARLPTQRSHVRIGAGTFIGARSVILPNVTIGKGCVIGAGSVVTHDIPDYCTARGAPARVVAQFDPATRTWKKSAPPRAPTIPDHA